MKDAQILTRHVERKEWVEELTQKIYIRKSRVAKQAETDQHAHTHTHYELTLINFPIPTFHFPINAWIVIFSRRSVFLHFNCCCRCRRRGCPEISFYRLICECLQVEIEIFTKKRRQRRRQLLHMRKRVPVTAIDSDEFWRWSVDKIAKRQVISKKSDDDDSDGRHWRIFVAKPFWPMRKMKTRVKIDRKVDELFIIASK